MMRSSQTIAIMAGMLLHAFPCDAVHAAEAPVSSVQSFECSGFDTSLRAVQFSFSRSAIGAGSSLGFASGEPYGLFNEISKIDRIAQSEGSSSEEYFLFSGGQKYRLSLEGDGDRTVVLVRGTYPSEDPTLALVARCQTVSKLPTLLPMLEVGRSERSDRVSGRPIRVSQAISFSCAFVGSAAKMARLTLQPDSENTLIDRAEIEVDGDLRTGTAMLLSETLDGIGSVKVIVSMEPENVTFLTNGKTGWFRTFPRNGDERSSQLAVCHNSVSAAEKNEQ